MPTGDPLSPPDGEKIEGRFIAETKGITA